MYAKVALRDLGLLALAGLFWWGDASLHSANVTGAAATAVGLVAGILTALCAYLAHEWGHLTAARLASAVVHPPERVATIFLFNFDSDRNDRRGFLWMSCGGFALSAAGLALLLAVLPLEALSGRMALGLAALGVLATAVLELPPFFRVLRGGEIPRGLGYRTSEPGGVAV